MGCPSCGTVIAQDAFFAHFQAAYENDLDLSRATWMPGMHGHAIGLTGDDGSYGVKAAAPPILKPTSEAAVAAWIKFTKTDKLGGTIASMGDNYNLRVAPNGTTRFSWYDGRTWRSLATTDSVKDGNWHHAVGQKTATGAEIYIDNALAASDTITGSIVYSKGQDFLVGNMGTAMPTMTSLAR